MKLRQIHIQNFRNFRGDYPPLSFLDEHTEEVRPLTVLVGSNGSGKTTVFNLIESFICLLYRALVADRKDISTSGSSLSLLSQLTEQGFSSIELQLEEGWPKFKPNNSLIINNQEVVRLAVGERKLASSDKGIPCIIWPKTLPDLTKLWLDRFMSPLTREQFLQGGLIFFPHNRWIEHNQQGVIEPPPEKKDWIFHFEAKHTWQGSLPQLWVWQNYLDLEEEQEGRKNLAPFVDTIETILGRGQQIFIRQGLVFIKRPHLNDEVEPHQLPSGEQQVLTLFGELARHLRQGAIILIDEIENSLHPALKRVVLFHLRQLARKHDLQIILSTHSMEIVSVVNRNEIINLDD